MRYLITFTALFFFNYIVIDAHILSKRVVGGDVVSISQLPWMAMLLDEGEVYCGGTILSKRAVLTAAQCLFHRKPHEIKVVVGISRTDEVNKTKLLSLTTAIPHPDYNSTRYFNDIAILVLEKDIDVIAHPPISLPSPKGENYKNGCVAGWGRTAEDDESSEELRKACFTSNEFKDCSENYANRTNSDIHICVGGNGKDSCFGDSGGPLYTEIEGRATQIGIVSFGDGCGRHDGVYTRLSAFVDWIKKTISTVN